MATVKSSVLHDAMTKLRNSFDYNRVEFFVVGNGIENPIHVMVGPRGHGTIEPDEAIEEGKVLIEAGKAAKEFEYNGYFVEWGE